MFNIRRRALGVATLIALSIAATGCEPPALKMPPVQDRVALASDSIGFQAMYYGSAGKPARTWDTYRKIGLGWKAEHAQPQVTADVAGVTTSPDVLVVEFGHNYGRGFTQSNRNAVTQMMFSPDPAACVVIVLPYAPDKLSATHRQAIAQYRDHVNGIAYVRPHTAVVDWGEVVAEHPEYLDEDGIHLLTPETTAAQDLELAATGEIAPVNEEAAAAFVDLMQSGVNAC